MGAGYVVLKKYIRLKNVLIMVQMAILFKEIISIAKKKQQKLWSARSVKWLLVLDFIAGSAYD